MSQSSANRQNYAPKKQNQSGVYTGLGYTNRGTAATPAATPVTQAAPTVQPATQVRPNYTAPAPAPVTEQPAYTAPTYSKPASSENSAGGIKIPDFLQKNRK